MNESLAYFAQISRFGPSLQMFYLVLAADLLFTTVHVWQEAQSRPPLYRVFGAVAGFWFPGWIGFLAFTVILPIFLWTVGLFAYAGLHLSFGPHPIGVNICALGIILGARLSDSIFSHWKLAAQGYRPNPALSSTVLYTLEVILILSAFQPGLALDPTFALCGFAIGAIPFLIVIPLMKWLRTKNKANQRPPWIPGTRIPDWAINWV
jgi:hypothetical protein